MVNSYTSTKVQLHECLPIISQYGILTNKKANSVMSTPKRTTMAIVAERKLRLERLAIDASHVAGKSISWTDLVNHLIDNYAKEAAKDLIHSVKNQVQN
ncbi:hypothetical protein [Xenorhabdus bovienii]|nr:hypothetical protein [Xenorhabdus bovienii]